MTVRLFGFEVEFSITMLFLLLIAADSGLQPAAIALTFLAMATSILLHELGHAFVARSVGGDVVGIRLYALGGVTMWRGPTHGWKRIVVAAAGSTSSILIGAVIWLIASQGILGGLAKLVMETPWKIYLGDALNAGSFPIYFLASFMWFNVVWGAFNLLPIGGLDGSTILGELLEKVVPGHGRMHGAIIGLLIGGLAAVLLYQRDLTFVALIVVFFSVRGFIDVRRRSQ